MRSIVITSLIMVTFGIAGCLRSEVTPSEKTAIRISTGAPGGATTPMVHEIVRVFSEKLSDYSFSIKESSGGVANLEDVENGLADVAVTQSDLAYAAFTTGSETSPRPHSKIRAMSVLYTAALHLLIAPATQFREVIDLRGKRIGVGPHGSGTEATVRRVLPQVGVSLSDVKLEWLPFSEIPARLADHTLDAEFVITSFPSVSATDAIKAGARLVSMRRAAEQLRKDYPFLRPVRIPSGIYGLADDIETIGVDTVLVCRADLSEDVVNLLLATFFDSVAKISEVQPALRSISLEQAPGTSIPLHPGAARFYRERELFR